MSIEVDKKESNFDCLIREINDCLDAVNFSINDSRAKFGTVCRTDVIAKGCDYEERSKGESPFTASLLNIKYRIKEINTDIINFNNSCDL